MTTQLSVIVPCYNEEALIERTAERLLSVLPSCSESFEVVFCNDGSSDRTGALLATLESLDPRLRAIGYEDNRGAGYAFRQLLDAARGTIIVHMDADLAMDPEEVCRECLARLRECDIAIASRYIGTTADYPLRRRIPSAVYRKLYRVLFKLPIQDAMSGFFGMRREVISMVKPLEMDGFEVYLELFAGARARGARIEEFPAKFIHDTSSGEVSVLATAPRQLIRTLQVWWKQRGKV